MTATMIECPFKTSDVGEGWLQGEQALLKARLLRPFDSTLFFGRQHYICQVSLKTKSLAEM